MMKFKEYLTPTLLNNPQSYFLLNNLLECLGYILVNGSLKYLYTNPQNNKKEFIYITSDRDKILEVLDLENNEYLDKEDDHKASHYHLCRWITNSKRYDSKNFFETIKNIDKIDVGLISDLGKINKKSEPCLSFYWENKVFGPWFDKYVHNILNENRLHEVIDRSTIESILGPIKENSLNKAFRFINSRFSHFLDIDYKDIEKELKNWYRSL